MNPTKEELNQAKVDFNKNGGKIKTEKEEFKPTLTLRTRRGWGGATPCQGKTHKAKK